MGPSLSPIRAYTIKLCDGGSASWIRGSDPAINLCARKPWWVIVSNTCLKVFFLGFQNRTYFIFPNKILKGFLLYSILKSCLVRLLNRGLNVCVVPSRFNITDSSVSWEKFGRKISYALKPPDQSGQYIGPIPGMFSTAASLKSERPWFSATNIQHLK